MWGKTDIETTPLRHVPVKQLDFKDKKKMPQDSWSKILSVLQSKKTLSDFLIAAYKAKQQ